MNNKGFTLVELLAVIVILLGISLIVVSSISATLGRHDEKECKEQIALAKNAAKIYFSLNDTSSVKVKTLKDEGYFNEKSKTDRLQDNDSISFTNNGYNFNGTGECKDS